jgi:tetratricopeptide (TPR) repeat protein
MVNRLLACCNHRQWRWNRLETVSQSGRHRTRVPFLLCLFLAALAAPDAFSSEPATAYERELAEIDAGLASFERKPPVLTGEFKRSIYFFYRRASLTGSVSDIQSAQAQIGKVLKQLGSVPDFYLIRANLELKLHQIAEAKSDLAKAADGGLGSDFTLLQAEIALQEGRHADAIACCRKSIQTHRTWEGLARLAHLNSLAGDFAGAQREYLAAENEITAKEMRSYAWVEVQRGLLEFNRGNHREARAHYERASKAYSGYWFVDGCLAELDAAQGQFQQAIARYEALIARTAKPEFQQALGDLYVFLARRELAKPWHDKAYATYLESTKQGHLHYLHHLSGFCSDVQMDGSDAVKWARRDMALRTNWSTADALAWALFRNRQFTEALGAIEQAMSYRVVDIHMLSHAATIYLAAGNREKSKELQRKVTSLNPTFEATFHTHR